MTNQKQPEGKMTWAELLKKPELLDKLADEIAAYRATPEKSDYQLFLEALGRRLVDSLADGGSISLIAKMLADLGLKVRADKLRKSILAVLNDGLSHRSKKERARYELALANVEKDTYGVRRIKAGKKPENSPNCPQANVKSLEDEIQRLRKELDVSLSMRKSLEAEILVLSEENQTFSEIIANRTLASGK